MGQKIHPIGLRLGYTKPWNSRWFADKDYAKTLHEDIRVRKMVKSKLYHAGVSKVEIERSGDQVTIIIHTARPGIIIGRKGAEVDKLKADLEKMINRHVYITIKEIKKPELDAQLVTENIAVQLEKRVAFRRAMKRSVASALRLGAQGIKIRCSGRLAGAEIARTEWYLQGRVPLHTLRADIDYGFAEAHTTMGQIGIKAWIYKGEILPAASRGRAGGELERREEGCMLAAKKVKHWKMHKGRMRGKAYRGCQVTLGDYGLKALEPGWITNRQLEAARIAMTRHVKRGGRVWVRIFPDKPITKKPAETRMGKGKGNPEYWVAVVKPGRMLYEMDGVTLDVAKEALRLASHKLPIATRFVARGGIGGNALRASEESSCPDRR